MAHILIPTPGLLLVLFGYPRRPSVYLSSLLAYFQVPTSLDHANPQLSKHNYFFVSFSFLCFSDPYPQLDNLLMGRAMYHMSSVTHHTHC
jgi:hypothetical protein